MGNPGAPRLGAEPWRRGGASRSYPRRSRCGSRSASIASPHPITPASHTVPGRLQPPRPGQATGAPCRLSDPARALWAPWVTIQWLNHAVGRNSFPYADGPPQRVDSPDGDVGESSRKRSWRVAVKPQGSRRRNGLRPAVEKAAPRGDRGGRAGPAGPRPSAQPGPGRRARLPVLGGPGWGAGGPRGPPGRTRLQQGSAPPIAPERCPSGRGEATVVGRGVSSRGPGGRSPSRTRRPPRAHADGGGSCEPGPRSSTCPRSAALDPRAPLGPKVRAAGPSPPGAPPPRPGLCPAHSVLPLSSPAQPARPSGPWHVPCPLPAPRVALGAPRAPGAGAG